MFWFGLVWFIINWCVSIVQIGYHTKSRACSFKNVRVMPILVLFGMVCIGLVMFWFHLVSILTIWCVPIVQIYYHAKSRPCSFKNDWVIFILVLLGLIWYGFVLFIIVVIVIIIIIIIIIIIVVADIHDVLVKTPVLYQVPELCYLCCHCRPCCCHSRRCNCHWCPWCPCEVPMSLYEVFPLLYSSALILLPDRLSEWVSQ